MAKYRKLPVEVEAVQLSWENQNEIYIFAKMMVHEGTNVPRFCYVSDDGKAMDSYPQTINPVPRIGLVIPTLEGDMLAVESDWIIKGVQGEFYPCKPDIFEQTYAPADDEPELSEILDKVDAWRDRVFDNHETNTSKMDDHHERRGEAGL
jgi:hypothetical protein